MLIMRFNRTGKKNRVSYRIVLQEHTAAPGKRHVEILGSHDPHSKTTVLKEGRIQHWLKEGVQTSDAVYNLFITKGILTGKKRVKKMPRPEPKVEEAAPEVEEAPVEEVKEEETAPEAAPSAPETVAEAEPAPETKEEAEATEEPAA
jgi:ribosomal protein S16